MGSQSLESQRQGGIKSDPKDDVPEASDQKTGRQFREVVGDHAYVKPDGHVMDDLWFYDINTHAWTCLYPGINTKTITQRVKDKELSLDADGQLIDNDKQPVPVHTLVHAWGYRYNK